MLLIKAFKSNQILIIIDQDLTYINRDLNKIILIDWDEHSYELQPRNALHRLKKWEGEDNDADLVYLASFLKSIKFEFIFRNFSYYSSSKVALPIGNKLEKIPNNF